MLSRLAYNQAMAKFLVALTVAVVFFTIYALVDCLMTRVERVRAIPKALWVFVIIIVTPIGGILWLTLGKDRSPGAGPVRRLGPDDDPAFLRRLGRDKDQDVRIRRLEQELAELDDDSKE
jgi:hypothetical protein